MFTQMHVIWRTLAYVIFLSLWISECDGVLATISLFRIWHSHCRNSYPIVFKFRLVVVCVSKSVKPASKFRKKTSFAFRR